MSKWLRGLKKRDRQFIMAGTAVFLVIVVVFLVILPFRDARAAVREDLEKKKVLLQRSLQTVAGADLYRNRLDSLAATHANLERGLLDARSSNVASTRLLEYLNGLAEENDVTITRSNPIPEQKEGEYTKVTLQLNLECGILELTSFLRSISTHDKFLKLEEFNLNIGRSRRRRQNSALRPRIRVSDFVRLS